MRTSPVRSLLLWSVGCVLLAAWVSVSDAAACAKICKQTSIWGSGPGPSYAPCECTTIVNGLGSGANGCACGICYQQVSTRVIGYAKLTDGQCPSGSTDCGDCDSDSESGSGSNLTKTTAPPSTESTATNTPSPSLTSSAPSPTSDAPSSAAGNTASLTAPPAVTTPAVTTPVVTTPAVTTPVVTTPVVTTPVVTTPAPTPLASKNTTATDVTSNGSTTAADGKSATAPTNVSAATEAPSTGTTKSSSNDGLATWQIALIICSCVLVIAVAMTTITSCYCKARNRMKDNMQDEEERHEYEGYWNPNASGGLTERSGQDQLAHSAFNPAMTQAGRSSFTSTHSRPNSTKNMPYSEPTYAVDERISAGMGVRPAPRSSIGSVADLPGVFQPFPQRDIRPSHEVGSRKNIAIEL